MVSEYGSGSEEGSKQIRNDVKGIIQVDGKEVFVVVRRKTSCGGDVISF